MKLREREPYLFTKGLVMRYFEHDCGRCGAALAYYFLFSLFPFLFFLSQLLGQLNLPQITAASEFARIVPASVLEFVNVYLAHVSSLSSGGMLALGLVVTFYFPMRAVAFLMHAVGNAYGTQPNRPFLKRNLLALGFTVLMALSLALSLIIIVLGQNALHAISAAFPLSPQFISVWNYLRFAFLGVMIFATLALLYRASAGVRLRLRFILPGAGAALTAWLLLSVGFSFYVENMGRYSVIYGSLGVVIVLLVWLFLSSVTIVMGAELNGLLLSRSKKARQ